DEARDLIQRLSDQIEWFKIGLQLFTTAGPAIVEEVKKQGKKVFLDLKFHDIPSTVRQAVRSACALGADMLTVHLGGGSEMCRAAVESRAGLSTVLLGVTVLTSQNDQTLAEVGTKANVAEQVLLLATLAKATGVTGLVASPHEIRPLRERFGSYFTIVTPGVRPAGSDRGDQKRVMTPLEALKAGSDYLVIGRSITAAADPAAALNSIVAEVAGGDQ
ncbi:MAG TPA: orotidine-5'-phosphate decarboxylase, partial [Chthoniobacterales bacterium]|nr:orotidine-5'-phosphate decarboxylase [Chthoniobacterales bacterium]